DCVCEYLQTILKTFLLGILKPEATSAFGAVSNMMFTLEPTSGSVHSTSAVSFGLHRFAFACCASHLPCVVPASAQTAPNEGTSFTLRYICTDGMHPSFWRIFRKAPDRVSSCWAWITPLSCLRTEFRACASGSVSDGYLRL